MILLYFHWQLWMGTHPKGPNYVLLPGNKGHLLSDYLDKNPYLVGEALQQRFKSSGLPFLFKILSVEKALSIQMHPTKVQFIINSVLGPIVNAPCQ